MFLAPVFETYLTHKESFLDKFIDSGTDQELFAAGYIHGHVSLVAARTFGGISDVAAESQATDHIRAFEEALCQNIDIAIDNAELGAEDARDVKLMLERFKQA